MKYIAIVFTFMFPAAEPMEQHFEYRTMDECESFVARTQKVYKKAKINDFHYQLECKAEKRVKEEEKRDIVEEA